MEDQFTPHSKKEDKNLILFPSSKHYPLVEESLDDPLEELMSEFQVEDEIIEDEITHPIDRNEEILPRPKNTKSKEDIKYRELFQLVNDQLKTLKDANERVKFYLDEIDFNQ